MVRSPDISGAIPMCTLRVGFSEITYSKKNCIVSRNSSIVFQIWLILDAEWEEKTELAMIRSPDTSSSNPMYNSELISLSKIQCLGFSEIDINHKNILYKTFFSFGLCF